MTLDEALKRMAECVHMAKHDPGTSRLSAKLDAEALDVLRGLKPKPSTLTSEEKLKAFEERLDELCVEFSVELEPEDGHGALLLIDRKAEPSKAGFSHNLVWEREALL